MLPFQDLTDCPLYVALLTGINSSVSHCYNWYTYRIPVTLALIPEKVFSQSKIRENWKSEPQHCPSNLSLLLYQDINSKHLSCPTNIIWCQPQPPYAAWTTQPEWFAHNGSPRTKKRRSRHSPWHKFKRVPQN